MSHVSSILLAILFLSEAVTTSASGQRAHAWQLMVEEPSRLTGRSVEFFEAQPENLKYDVQCDYRDRIIVANNVNGTLTEYGGDGHFVRDIPVSWKGGDSGWINVQHRVGIDGQNALYVNSEQFGLELRIEKLDSIDHWRTLIHPGDYIQARWIRSVRVFMARFGGFVINPDNYFPTNWSRVVGFFVSKQGNILLDTYPTAVPLGDAEKRVYTYSSDGEFLGKKDYRIEGSTGEVIRLERDTGGNVYVTSSRPALANYVLASRETSHLTSVPILESSSNRRTRKYEERWIFCGIDADNNVYITNGEFVRVFDRNLESEEIIRLDLKTIEQSGVRVDLGTVRISKSGEVYVYGTRKAGDTSSFVLLRIPK